MRILGAVMVVGGALALGSGAAPSATPLSRCGVSQVRHVPRNGWMVVGTGPVSLALVGGTRRAQLDISQSQPDKHGWRGQKTPWFVPKTYRGLVTVTARRIDRVGQVRLAYVHGQHLRKLVFGHKKLKLNPVGRFYFLPAAALFRSTGCYAFHVSGPRFSERLVVRVVA
jgi:hypothetical protein